MTTHVEPSAAALTAKFSARMSEVRGAAGIGGRAALLAAGDMLTKEVKRLISHPYPPASQPSEPPHQRRGEDGGLLASYGYKLEGDDTVVVGSGGADPEMLPVFLEFGTVKMKPRPHLRPAVANMMQGRVLQELFVRSIEETMRRAVG